MNSEITQLIRQLEQAYDHPTWHGPNLRNALRGVSVEAALFKPQATRHCIWELMLHCAYWKYIVIQRLSTGSSQEFARSPANFPAPPKKPSAKLWREDLKLLHNTHGQLLQLVQKENPKNLDKLLGTEYSRANTILGTANHDIYHAGQIRLLRKMFETEKQKTHTMVKTK